MPWLTWAAWCGNTGTEWRLYDCIWNVFWQSAKTKVAPTTLNQLKRRLPFLYTVQVACTPETSLSLVNIIWDRIRGFLANPPRLRVVTYEDDPFTNNFTVKVWNDTTRQSKLQILKGHADAVLDIAMSSNIIVTASNDKSSKVWGIEKGDLRQTLCFADAATAVDAEDDIIVVGTRDGVLQVWKAGFWQEPQVAPSDALGPNMTGHSGSVLAIALCSGRFVSGGRDAIARVWDSRTGDLQCTLKGHRSRIMAVALHRALNIAVTASFDGTARVWNSYHGELLQTLWAGVSSPSGQVPFWQEKLEQMDPCVAVGIAKDVIVTGSGRGVLRTWNRKTSEIRVLTKAGTAGPLGSRKSISVQLDGAVVSCRKAGYAEVWKTQSEQPDCLLMGGFPARRLDSQSYVVAIMT